jgi:isocitrate dehydrogenase
VRPCRYYEGTPSPHKRPQDLDVIVYRENTEDIYMGVEWEADDAVGQELRKHLNEVVIPANGKLGKRQIPGRIRHRHQTGEQSTAASATSARRSSTLCALRAASAT